MTIQLKPLDFHTLEGQSPFTNLCLAAERTIGAWRFVVLNYGAYNAHGLIGSEYNGIAVLESVGKQVVLDQHLQRDCGTNPAQAAEFGRLIHLPDEAFMDFINTHPRTRRQYLYAAQLRALAKELWRPKVKVVQTPLEFTADQNKFARHFQKFVAKDCRSSDWHQWFYGQLSHTFSHIAHYNRGGFYAEWFANPAARTRFIQHTLEYGGYGEWRGVENFLKRWLREHAVLEQYRARSDADQVEAERAQLRRLAAKHPEVVETL